MTGERPLDGVEDVAWDDLLRTAEDRTATGADLIGVLRDLVGGADPERAAERISDLLIEDADYVTTECGVDHGYVTGAAAVIPFLARIAAAHPATAGAAIDLIRQFVNAPMDRPGATDAELDGKADARLAAVRDSREALATAADRAPEIRAEVASLLAEVEGGAYPLRWRGVAQPLARARITGLTVVAAADRLLLAARSQRADLTFLDPDGGATVAALPPRRPMTVLAPTDGPGAVVVDGRRLTSWRHLDGAWATTTISRRWFSPRITALATTSGDLDTRSAGEFSAGSAGGAGTGELAGFADGVATQVGTGANELAGFADGVVAPVETGAGEVVAGLADGAVPRTGELYAGFADGAVTRLDPGTGERIGQAVRLTGAVPLHLHPYRSGDDRFVLVITTTRDVFRADLTRGLVLDPPVERIRGFLGSFALGARTGIAVFVDESPASCVVRRFDAATGAEIGRPIATGCQFDPWGTAGCTYSSGGQPMLAVASGRQIRRFDAGTGAPEPVLTGHRRPVTGLAAAVIGGRTTLFSADGASVRRWDAATGTPWPATLTDPD